MSIIHTRIRVAADDTISGSAPGATPGEHDAAIILHHPAPSKTAQEEALTAIREIQARIAQLPELDPRPSDEILGYDENGLFR